MVGVAGALPSHKIKEVERQTGQGDPADFQGVLPTSSNRDGPPKKQAAAPSGNGNGGKAHKKASNLQSRDYLAGRVDAIADLIAPPFECPHVIERLIELADAALPDADIEPSLGAPEASTIGLWGHSIFGVLAVNWLDQTRWADGGSGDLEGEHDGREPCGDWTDRTENPPHLEGGNGDVSILEARQ